MGEIPKRPKKAVVDGKPTYTSASSLQTAKDCPRKWYFQKVMGLTTPSTKSQAIGTKTHGEIEHYLKTGELTLGPVAMAGKHLIPDPCPDYLIEHRIWDSQLKAHGIPIEGFIDLIVPPLDECPITGNSYCVEVIDWKTTSNLKWAKNGSDLPKTIQMGIYAEWARREYDADRVRLSHVYFQTRGRPQTKKSTIVVDSEQIVRKWESIESVARNLYQYAAETDIKHVPANRGACDNYGGCPFYDKCPRSIGEIFDMSVLDDECPPELLKAWETIKAAGRGLPPISGDVAKWLEELCGPGPVTGEGELGGLPSLHHPDTVILLAEELEREAQDNVTEDDPGIDITTPAVLPPDAPESNPELAADPVEPTLPMSVIDMKQAKTLKKANLLVAYENCLNALKERLIPEYLVPPKDLEDAVDALESRTVTSAEMGEVTITTVTPTIYVNCIPPEHCNRLEPYIFGTATQLADAAKCPDIRMSDKKSLAFGAWRGALTAAVKENPPQGSYVVVCKGEDFAEVVVAALEGTHKIVRGF
jgi:hypothetical protein